MPARQALASRRRATLGQRVLALGFGTLLALLLLEVSLRVFGYRGGEERAQRVFDAKYGTVRKDSWIFGFHIDPKVHRAVDLRGQLVPLQKAPGETRVLFLGDSATEGAFVKLEESYPLRFAARLRALDPDTHVRVVNAGVWGMTTIDEFHLLEDKLLPLRPDVVVIGLFMSNDINWNLGHAQKRVHYLAPRWLDALRTHSALAHFLFLRALQLNQRFRFVRSDRLGTTLVPAQVALIDEYGLHMLSYPAGELALYMRKPSALANEAFEVLRDVLAQFQALGRARGFETRLLIIPTPSAVAGRLTLLHYPNFLQELRAQGVTVHEGDLDFDLPTRRVLAICEQLRLPCVDATPGMRRVGLRAFFPGDEHPTVLGHEALAEALIEAPR